MTTCLEPEVSYDQLCHEADRFDCRLDSPVEWIAVGDIVGIENGPGEEKHVIEQRIARLEGVNKDGAAMFCLEIAGQWDWIGMYLRMQPDHTGWNIQKLNDFRVGDTVKVSCNKVGIVRRVNWDGERVHYEVSGHYGRIEEKALELVGSGNVPENCRFVVPVLERSI